ncbi:MAG: acetoacetate--CoA ligase [Gammaproteobacteria bacterium]|nr:acetoacetate--CoA ligase [Gammaproteobacteria bacterium]
MSEPLWQPGTKQLNFANLTGFRQQIEQQHKVKLPDYNALYEWSRKNPTLFWTAIWEDGGVVASERGDTVLEQGEKMPGARWFPQARLNYAENLLRLRDDQDALIFRGEEKVKHRLSHNELYDQVSVLAQALRTLGVTEGDRVAGYLPNMPEAIVAMLAATSLGATWSSCSPDFGVNGVVDRFGQIEPKVLFAANGYYYNGKSFDSLEKLAEIQSRLPTLKKTIVIPYTEQQPKIGMLGQADLLADITASYLPTEIDFRQLPFDHPLFIMFSSGTTGVPKCIVHGAGGTLLQHLKEHRLHSDVHPGDRVFYFTTCGWMMWNWLVSGLASGATLLLYDGSPFYPDGNTLFDYADDEQMTLLGTSAKYIDALKKAGLSPAQSHKLKSLRTLCSTGSPLVPESFDYVYSQIKQDLCLSSISGGTDIISCFALGNPTLPVYRGELQCRGLGMAVDVWNDEGNSIRGEKGELVCTAPFPSMPISFWNDPDGQKYHSAYFDRFDNIWCHGDYVELTIHDGMVIYGRSDAVLNPGGVRIGTAEIYRQVEQLDEVLEGLVIGQEWHGDVRVVLFVRLQPDLALDQNLIDRIKKQIRANTTPRHVPARVVQVDDIPRTKSGKIVELAVREVVHDRVVKNREALANPEALTQFKDRSELES